MFPPSYAKVGCAMEVDCIVPPTPTHGQRQGSGPTIYSAATFSNAMLLQMKIEQQRNGVREDEVSEGGGQEHRGREGEGEEEEEEEEEGQ